MTAGNDSDVFNKRWRFWRCQFHLRIMRHRSPLPDRWVVQTSAVYDRKNKR